MSDLEKIYGVHAVEAMLRHHPKRVKQVGWPMVAAILGCSPCWSWLRSLA